MFFKKNKTRKVFYTMAILAAAGLLQKVVCADKAKIADVADQAVKGERKKLGDGSLGLRSFRGSPTNRRRVASEADIDAVEKKSLNDKPSEAFLSIIKNDGMSSCKGILLRSDWIMTSGGCADGALNITAWIGVNGTSYLSNHSIKANSEVEHHLISKADIKMSPGFESTKTDGGFAMLHLNVASNQTAALAKSELEALGWYSVYDFWSNVWYWQWSDGCWIWDGNGWCDTCTVTCWECWIWDGNGWCDTCTSTC